MPVNLRSLHDASRDLAARTPENQGGPVYLGGDGALTTVLRPLGEPPGLWIRFKAALINVPLIGRLQSVRAAGLMVSDAALGATSRKFAADVQQQLAADFGEPIAKAAVGTESSSTPLTAHRTVRVLNETERLVRQVATVNRNLLTQSASGNNVAGRYAAVMLMASLPDYFASSLRNEDRDRAVQHVQERLAMLERVGIQPGSALNTVLADIDAELQRAPFGKLRASTAAIYVERIEEIIDLARDEYIVAQAADAARPEATSSSSSSSSSTAPRDGAGHNADVRRTVALLYRQIDPQTTPDKAERARTAWQQFAAVRNRLMEELQPPSTDGRQSPEPRPVEPDQVDGPLRSVVQGRKSLTADELFRQTRSKIIGSEMAREFAPQNSESLLWNAVIEAAEGHPKARETNFTDLLVPLAKEMLTDLESRASLEATPATPEDAESHVPLLCEHLKCPNRLHEIVAATRQKLIENVRQATRGHLDALAAIESSRTLNRAQQDILIAHAEGGPEGVPPPRRLDPIQVEHFEKIARTIAGQIPRMQAAIAVGESPAALFDSMAEIDAAYSAGTRKVLEHAESMWVSRSFDGTDREQEQMDLYIRLALADLEEGAGTASAKIATQLSGPPASDDGASVPPPARVSARLRRSGAQHEALRSRLVELGLEKAEETDPVKIAAPPSGPRAAARPHVGADDPVQQFRAACNQAPAMSTAKLAMFYKDLIRVARYLDRDNANRSGAGQAQAPVQQQNEQDADTAHIPLYRIAPELLVRTLSATHGNADGNPALADHRVLAGGVAEEIVREGFDPTGVLNPERHAIRLDGNRALAVSLSIPLRDSPPLREVLPTSDIIVDGQRLRIGLQDPAQALIDAFFAKTQSRVERPVDYDSKVLAACLASASDALERFSADANAAAFDPPVAMANLRTVHELTRDGQGGWNIRSTRVSWPMSRDNVPLDTDGVALYSLTHHVTLPDAKDDDPRVELTDSKLMLEF